MNTETETKLPAIKTIVDAVTMAEIPSNNTQIAKYALKYSITQEEALNSYVGQLGRRQILAESLDEAGAIEKYKLHPNVVAKLRCITRAKIRKPRTPKVKVVPEPVILPEVSLGATVDEGESVMISLDEVTE